MKNANFGFQSKGRQTDRGYEVEFIIPYSVIPFPNGKNQSWKIELFTGYIDDDNEDMDEAKNTNLRIGHLANINIKKPEHYHIKTENLKKI